MHEKFKFLYYAVEDRFIAANYWTGTNFTTVYITDRWGMEHYLSKVAVRLQKISDVTAQTERLNHESGAITDWVDAPYVVIDGVNNSIGQGLKD